MNNKNMKQMNKIFGTMLIAASALTSCVDDSELQYAFEKPASIQSMEYLNDYEDWGLGIGDLGIGPIPNPQSPIPNPQSPIPNC